MFCLQLFSKKLLTKELKKDDLNDSVTFRG